MSAPLTNEGYAARLNALANDIYDKAIANDLKKAKEIASEGKYSMEVTYKGVRHYHHRICDAFDRAGFRIYGVKEIPGTITGKKLFPDLAEVVEVTFTITW